MRIQLQELSIESRKQHIKLHRDQSHCLGLVIMKFTVFKELKMYTLLLKDSRKYYSLIQYLGLDYTSIC